MRQQAGQFREHCAQWVAQVRAAGRREAAGLAGRVDSALADAGRAKGHAADLRRTVEAGGAALRVLQAATAHMVPRGEAAAARREAEESIREAERMAALAALQSEEAGALAARLQAGQEEAVRLRAAIQVRESQ